MIYGGIPKWPKGADCKSVVSDFDGSNPSPSTIDLSKSLIFQAFIIFREFSFCPANIAQIHP